MGQKKLIAFNNSINLQLTVQNIKLLNIQIYIKVHFQKMEVV